MGRKTQIEGVEKIIALGEGDTLIIDGDRIQSLGPDPRHKRRIRVKVTTLAGAQVRTERPPARGETRN